MFMLGFHGLGPRGTQILRNKKKIHIQHRLKYNFFKSGCAPKKGKAEKISK